MPPPSLNPVLSTFRNALATHKTHLPLPPVPALAQVKVYPVNSVTKSGFSKTVYEPFAGKFDPLTGAVKNCRGGYSVRHEAKFGTYLNWPHSL